MSLIDENYIKFIMKYFLFKNELHESLDFSIII